MIYSKEWRMRISEKERLTELYHCLKAVPKELWKSSNYEVVQTALADKKVNLEQSMSFHIFGKVAHSVSGPEQFVESVRTDELPAVKLSDPEIELLKGGAKQAAKKISKGEIGNSGDSLKIFQAYYAQAAA